MRFPVALTLSGTIVIMALPAKATIIHVPGDYPTIQGAINASSNGDTVLVAAGIYQEHINFLGKAIEVMSEDGAESTIIEGQTFGSPIVRFVSGETSSSVLNGFTIQLTLNAAALYMNGSSALVKSNIILVNNGGALRAENGSFPNVKSNVFVNNTALTGGAIDSYQGDIIVDGNQFISNSAATHGGAIFLRQSNGSVIHHNLFYQNQCDALGGALCLSECSSIQVYNNTVTFNSTDQTNHGAGIALDASDSCSIYNNIITNNSGEGIYQGLGYSSTATYNDVWGNTVDYDGIDPGEGSISADPLFVGGVPFSFELTENSPCIDAGDPNSPFDPDGTIADMGAYYFQHGLGLALDIGNVSGSPEMSVSVPILTHGLSNIDVTGVELHINFDDVCLEYVDISTDYLTDALVNVVDNEIHILWEDYLNPISFPESVAVLDLQFTVTGQVGDTCSIEWLDGNELVDQIGEAIPGLEYLPGYVEVEEITDIFEDNLGSPQFYFLSQSYPNPFNATTTIRYILPRTSKVRIELYDILGRKVETLVNEQQPAGYHQVIWDAGDVSSGTYLYKIQAGQFVETRKIVLLK